MRLYRVTWVDEAWPRLQPWDPFHPLHLPVDRQGAGRFDNPHRYVALYGATSPTAAVGEAFGNSALWKPGEVARAKEGHPRCLVTIDVDEAIVLVDLDDAQTLVDLGLRPSDVVRRNRDRTQEVALRLWLEGEATRPHGVRWRSYWRPEWEVVTLWSAGLEPPWFPLATVTSVVELSVASAPVIAAADVLPRQLDTST